MEEHSCWYRPICQQECSICGTTSCECGWTGDVGFAAENGKWYTADFFYIIINRVNTRVMKVRYGSVLKGTSLYLTYPVEEDAANYLEWSLDADYMCNVDTDYMRPQTTEEITAMFKSDNQTVYFHIRSMADDELLGFAAIFNIEWNNQLATVAIGIGEEKNRGRGFGSEALTLLIDYAFNELNLFKLCLDVIDYNEQAKHVYEKLGFMVEGYNQQAVFRNQHRYDRIYMGLFKDEWLRVHGD